MKKIFGVLLLIIGQVLLFSCSEITKKNQSAPSSKEKQNVDVQTKKTDTVIKISPEENDFNTFIASIQPFKIEPVDSLKIEYQYTSTQNYTIGSNTIQIFKKDTFNIDWIKINNSKIRSKNLKTINPRVDGKRQAMFCNNLEKITLYTFNTNEILFLEFNSNPCNGLGCSVSDYLIYDVKNHQAHLFGSFRTADVNLYNFPINNKLHYIATEYQGDFHGATPIHFISRMYSLNTNGTFQLEKDAQGREYYYEITTFPKEETKKFEYKRNWF